MKIRYFALVALLGGFSTGVFAQEESGYSDNYIDDQVFEALMEESLPTPAYDRDAGFSEPELNPAIAEAIEVQGVSIDENESVFDGVGNYLGQVEDLYGVSLSEEDGWSKG